MATMGAMHASIPFTPRKRNWIRRRLIVDGPLQYRMLLPVLVFTAIQVVLLMTTLFYPLYKTAAQESNQLVQAALFTQVMEAHVCVWSVLAFTSLLAGIYTLVRSNRVAGPLYKLRNGLVQLASGEYPKIKFRDHDELRDFEPVTDLLSQRMAYLASSNALTMEQFGQRLQFLKRRLENQPVSRADVERELNAILVDFSQVHMLRTDA
jgi:hypothetical protein